MLGSSDIAPTLPGDDAFARALAELGRSLTSIARRVHADSGADGVGATLLVEGRSVFAGANRFTEAIDDVQYGLRQGPCLTAVARREVTASRTIGAGEERWDGFTAPAAVLGLRSVASTPVWSGSAVVGSLNFYGRDAATFDDTTAASLRAHSEPAGQAMVTAWLLAVAAANAHVLARAVHDREAIDIAVGLLMDRYRMTTSHARVLIGQLAAQDGTSAAQAARALTDHPIPNPPAPRTRG